MLQELREQETLLSGQANKKERSAIGKQIFSLKNSENYLSALRFLKSPDKERIARRAARAAKEAAAKELLEEYQKVKSSKDRAKLRLLLPKLGAEERGEAEALLEEWEEKSKQ